jgi:nucleotide-binding universal stress UspA family protein
MAASLHRASGRDVWTTTRDAEEALMKLETVLVPLDGSRLAEAALVSAVDLVKVSTGATLLLVRAAEASTLLPGTDPTDAQVVVVREAEAYLEAVAARLAEQGVTRVKTSVWYGPPAPAIVEAAEVAKADLIVMSTHGRSGLGRLIVGSVAESVVRGTRRPILLVRDTGAPLAPPAGAARPRTEAAHV